MKRVMNAAFSWRSGGGFYISGNKAQWGRRRSGGDTGTNMLRFIVVTTSLLALAGVASAASVVNRDAETHTLIVTEGGAQSEVAVPAGQTAEICPNGCFVTLPNGDRQALTGSEVIEITGGQARIR